MLYIFHHRQFIQRVAHCINYSRRQLALPNLIVRAPSIERQKEYFMDMVTLIP